MICDDYLPEIQKARYEVECRRTAWELADPAFEQTAWLSFVAAQERLNAIIAEARAVNSVDGAEAS